MYKVTLDGELIYTPLAEELSLIDPIVKLEANKSGSFTFGMAPGHPMYNSIVFRQSLIDVYQDDEIIFEGVPVSEESDFQNVKTVACEGELTFLNDTLQRQAKYTNQTTSTLLAAYLQNHNDQADANKQFQLGIVTVDGGNAIYRYTNYESTLKEIQEDLVDNFGGYLRVRHDSGVRYLDYLSDSPRTSSQVVKIGQNLIDLSKNLDSMDICTVLIPLGEKTGESDVEGLDKRLTIESVNSGRDYLVGTASGVYGNIWKTVTWNDVTTPAALKTKGQDYLDSAQWANLVIEATAFDLGLAIEDVQAFRVLDMIRVVSEPHGINRNFMLTKLQINLNNPGATKITLGEEKKLSLSAQSAAAKAEIERAETTIMVDAANNTRQILETSTQGNVYFRYNEDGVIYEIDIMDTDDPATATKIWRWNMGGWAYSNDGGQTYTVAATMDGVINASMIKAGVLQGVEVIAETGKIGGWDISGQAIGNTVYDETTDTYYRAWFQPPLLSAPKNTWVLSCQKKGPTDTGFVGLFILYSSGKLRLYNDDRSYVDVTGSSFSAHNADGTLAYTFGPNQLSWFDANGAMQTRINPKANHPTLSLKKPGKGGVSVETLYGVDFTDGNVFRTAFYPANASDGVVYLGMATSTSSYAAANVANIIQYRGFYLCTMRGQGKGVMASTFIPQAIAKLCNSDATCSWVYCAQNGQYNGQCYFKFNRHGSGTVYIKGSSAGGDARTYVYGLR